MECTGASPQRYQLVSLSRTYVNQKREREGERERGSEREREIYLIKESACLIQMIKVRPITLIPPQIQRRNLKIRPLKSAPKFPESYEMTHIVCIALVIATVNFGRWKGTTGEVRDEVEGIAAGKVFWILSEEFLGSVLVE